MQVNLHEDILTFTLTENLVAANLEELQTISSEQIEKYSSIQQVKMDFKNVFEIDSLGINLVVGLYKELKSREIGFSIFNTSKPIKNLFNLFKLSSYFEVL